MTQMRKLDASGNPLERERVQTKIEGLSLAKQSFGKECDINNIMRKFEKTGLVNHLNNHNGGYGNYIGYEDYHSSLNKILAADNAFKALPPAIRNKFSNDPAQFLEYAQNADNLPEMRELGLAPPEPPKLPIDEPPAAGGAPSQKEGGPPDDAGASTVAASAA